MSERSLPLGRKTPGGILPGWTDADLFEALVEFAPDALILADEDGCIVLANSQAAKLFGYTRAELQGTQVELLVPERYRGAHPGHRKGYLRNPVLRPMGSGIDLFALRKDGTEFAAEISLSPIRNAHRTAVAVAVRDVSDRKRAEARFRALIEAAPDATIIADADGRIVLANSQAERVFGYLSEDLIGQPVELLLPNRFRAKHIRHRADYAAAPNVRPMGVGLELLGRRASGSEFPVEISLSPLETEEGVLFSAAVRDISERKHHEAKVREAERIAQEEHLRAQVAEEALQARQEFLSVASHELRSPVNALQLQVEVLREILARPGDSEIESVVERTERIRATVARLVSLVENVLDFSRIAQGRLELDRDHMDLTETVREVLSRHEELADRTDCELRVCLVGRLHGRWDRVRIEQVITNLLSNALKFGAGQPIEVRLEQRNDEAVLVVRDYGEGIDPGDRDRILRRFERGEGHERHDGLGLGLYLAEQIVAAHGGRIEIDSRRGEGACFSVILPLGHANEYG